MDKKRKTAIIGIITGITIVIAVPLCFKYYNKPHLILHKTSFSQLTNWDHDNHQEALGAFKKSCVAISKLNENDAFNTLIPQSGKIKNWHKICKEADMVDSNNNLAARNFFESHFVPYHIYNNFKSKGLFTGYYLPVLRCSLKPDKKYIFPIYAIPSDLVQIHDLGIFNKQLKDIKITGQIKDNKLYPYPSRKEIATGILDKKAEILAWCNNKIDIFFAQIQGSAIIHLPSNKELLIGYHAANGHPYTAIGKALIENKELTQQNSSMDDIRAWFLKYPEKTDQILNKNASYVFFRILDTPEALGTQGVPLTPQRSLAIDKKYFSLGAPIWLETTFPQNSQQSSAPFNHLLIAQDTGGAIKGIIRGDVYWGRGDEAAFIGGHMKSQGEYWILLPKKED